MLTVAVMYPTAAEATFDHDYYMATHMPLVRRLWGPMGLQDAQVLRGAPAPKAAASPRYARRS